jgi:hypothetical protein
VIALLSLRRFTRGARMSASVAVLLGTVVAARPANRAGDGRFVSGLAFRISSSTTVYAGGAPSGQADEVMRGRGVAANNRARIEFLAFTPAPQGVTTDDFLIAADSGKAFVLHTANQRFTPATNMFNGPGVVALGRVMGGGGRGGIGGFVNQLELLEVTFNIEKLAVETVDGRQAQHYRVTTDYRVLWGEQAFPAHAVTEIWSTQLPTNIPNPFEPFIVADQSIDGPLIEYALKLRAIRSQVEGTPIKVTTTTTFSGIHDILGFQSYVGTDPTINTLTVIQQTAITGIVPADVDPKLLAVVEDPGAF